MTLRANAVDYDSRYLKNKNKICTRTTKQKNKNKMLMENNKAIKYIQKVSFLYVLTDDTEQMYKTQQ